MWRFQTLVSDNGKGLSMVGALALDLLTQVGDLINHLIAFG
ncbi:MAG: hypothetical protein ABJG15_13215 [Hyphomonadaceae bacterium]